MLLARFEKLASDAKPAVDFFELTISLKREEGQQIAVCEPLEDMMIGAGVNREDAIKDLCLCFASAVEAHIELGTLKRFLSQIEQSTDFDHALSYRPRQKVEPRRSLKRTRRNTSRWLNESLDHAIAV